jgi:hypothetical protein
LESNSLYRPDFSHEKAVVGIPPTALENWHFIPGQVWHQTHGCHKGEFLLKFANPSEMGLWRRLSWALECTTIAR